MTNITKALTRREAIMMGENIAPMTQEEALLGGVPVKTFTREESLMASNYSPLKVIPIDMTNASDNDLFVYHKLPSGDFITTEIATNGMSTVFAPVFEYKKGDETVYIANLIFDQPDATSGISQVSLTTDTDGVLEMSTIVETCAIDTIIFTEEVAEMAMTYDASLYHVLPGSGQIDLDPVSPINPAVPISFDATYYE